MIVSKEHHMQQQKPKLSLTDSEPPADWQPSFSRWRHGGWYVTNVHYESGACGCISRNYPDGQWRIVCDDRRVNIGEPGDITFKSRDAAARAEYALAASTKVRTADKKG